MKRQLLKFKLCRFVIIGLATVILSFAVLMMKSRQSHFYPMSQYTEMNSNQNLSKISLSGQRSITSTNSSANINSNFKTNRNLNKNRYEAGQVVQNETLNKHPDRHSNKYQGHYKVTKLKDVDYLISKKLTARPMSVDDKLDFSQVQIPGYVVSQLGQEIDNDKIGVLRINSLPVIVDSSGNIRGVMSGQIIVKAKNKTLSEVKDLLKSSSADLYLVEEIPSIKILIYAVPEGSDIMAVVQLISKFSDKFEVSPEIITSGAKIK